MCCSTNTPIVSGMTDRLTLDIQVDSAHRSLGGVAEEHVRAALLSGCGADVVVPRA